jgi:beta-glucosidase
MKNIEKRNQNIVFGDDFVWGAATAAYQIEGAANADGRLDSVWDTFCREPGKVLNGESGDVACDHYHKFRDDIAMMAEMGIKSYRFSFSWSRIIPEGTGDLNLKGIAFYNRLINTLLEYGITPYATLFHWDYPQALQDRGGWLNPESVDWFGEYTRVLAEHFSDRISNWFTLNEPPCFLGLGHVDGTHAPGLHLDWPEFFLACKHALMSHGRAVKVLRTEAKTPPRIGYVPISHIGIPKDESPENIQAARDFTFGIQNSDRKFWFSRLWLDPVVLGEWPTECIEILTKDAPSVSKEELDLMSQPIDFLGLNYYSAPYIQRGKDGKPEGVANRPGHPRTGFDWPLAPEGMYWSVRFHAERYGLPVMIAENGLSSLDWVSEDGAVHDPQRIDFLARYLRSLHRAYSEGFAIKGYFHWSLMDNFEWAEGYRHRFGLVHVDFATLKRTLKDSAHWYKEVILNNGLLGQKDVIQHAVVPEGVGNRIILS